MEYTMRSAFKRWLILHNEEFRSHGYIRIPNWFRWYIRTTKQWRYTASDEIVEYNCNKREMDYEQRRKHHGYYTFFISDEELLQLQRAEWIK